MPAANGDEHLDKLLGLGFGGVAIVSGLFTVVMTAAGSIGTDALFVLLIATGLLAIAYLVAGVYDTAYAKPRRGVSNLLAAAGMVLLFLSAFADQAILFAVAGAAFLFLAGGALVACGFGLNLIDHVLDWP